MTSMSSMVTPPEIAAEVSHHQIHNNSDSSPSSRSGSAVSSTSLARWRLAQDRRTTPQGSPNESLTTFDKYRSEEKKCRRVPQVVFTDPSAPEKASTRACGSPCEPTATAESPVYSNSVEERSYRAAVSDHVCRSPSDAHLRTEADSAAVQSRRRSVPPTHTVAGDEPVRWSFSYTSMPVNGGEREREEEEEEEERAKGDQLHEVASNDVASPAAIAAAVPAIAEARNAAAAAYADRWTDEMRQSTTEEASMLRAYRQLEVQLHEAERRLNSAEARQQKEVAALKAELEKERERRVKAELDREELLNQAALSPPLATPRGGGGPVVHNILHVDAVAGQRSQSLASGSGAQAAATTATTTTTTYISETFYEKMKEREERARAQVRKEFVRQAQESVYAEQKKTAEAEKAAALATQQLNKAEAELKASQEALQEATSVLEAKDVQLHERAIHIQELEAQLRLVQRQLESAERAGAQAEQQARRKLEEAQNLADMRQSELEAQRGFAHQLQAQLGMKTRDLFDQEADRESVLQVVVGLQTRCAALEKDLEISVKETTALLDQRRQHAEAEAQLLREHNEELKQRCAAAEAELAALKGKHVCDAKELVLLRQRYEKDLEEQRVEVRSLQLQLENLLAAARQKSSDASSATEVERQQQAALLRQYTADTAAAREELDRARAALQRENEKHLRTVLELSQQLTALRQANTRLEHTANVREHESAEATQLLARARDELSQLRDERRRLSRSLVDVREDSRMRSLMDGPDVLQRRVAELENVRCDLHEKLQQANNTIENMQQQQQACAMEWSRRDFLQEERRAVSDRQPTRNSLLQVSAPEFRAVVEGSGNSRARQPSRVSIASTPASLGLPELLASMGEQLEPILRPSAERRPAGSAHSLEGQIRGASSASSVPPTLRERRLQHTLAQEEGEQDAAKNSAVDGAWAVKNNNTKAAAAAQRGRVTSPDVVDSPSRPFAEREEGQRRERRERDDVPTSLPQRVVSHQQKYVSDVGAIKTANVPSAHAPPSRPRRSSQASLFSSSVVTDDVAGQRWGHCSDRSNSPPLPKPQNVHAERAATSAHRQHQQPVAERVNLVVPPSVDLSPIQQEVRNTSEKRNAFGTAEVRERDELESEPCWESEHHHHQLSSDASSSAVNQTPAQNSIEEVHTPSHHSAQHNSPPPPSSLVESQPAAPLQHGPASAGVDSRAASQRQWRSNEVSSLMATPSPLAVVVGEAAVRAKEDAGSILRYVRIPAEALFPVGRVNSADILSVAATPPPESSSALLKDAETSPNLFSNVQYASSVLSSSPLPLPAAQGHARTAATSAGPVRGSQHRAAIPDGALVIDVHKSTPPPMRRRAQVQ